MKRLLHELNYKQYEREYNCEAYSSKSSNYIGLVFKNRIEGEKAYKELKYLRPYVGQNVRGITITYPESKMFRNAASQGHTEIIIYY